MKTINLFVITILSACIIYLTIRCNKLNKKLCIYENQKAQNALFEYTTQTPYFTITQDTVIYTGKKDTVISITRGLRYYRLQFDGNTSNVKNIKINAVYNPCLEFGEPKQPSVYSKYRRVKNMKEQYSFDGINWFAVDVCMSDNYEIFEPKAKIDE